MTIKKTIENLDTSVKSLQENMLSLERRQDQQDKMMEMMHSLLSNQKMTIEMLVSLSKPSLQQQEQQYNTKVQTNNTSIEIIHETENKDQKKQQNIPMNRRVMV